jgi:hypothetical protein
VNLGDRVGEKAIAVHCSVGFTVETISRAFRMSIAGLLFLSDGQHHFSGRSGVCGISSFSLSRLVSVTVEPSDG